MHRGGMSSVTGDKSLWRPAPPRFRSPVYEQNLCGQGAGDGGFSGGMSLIEVLVALLVFVIVATAVAATQLTGKRLGGDALHRTRAMAAAGDIIQSIAANPTQRDRFLIEGAGSPSAASIVPLADCRAVVCTPAQLADFDLWQWQQGLLGVQEQVSGRSVGGLPSARGCIRKSGAELVVAISWLGITPAKPSEAADCGAGELGLYDLYSGAAGNNLKRRQVVLRYYPGA